MQPLIIYLADVASCCWENFSKS